MEKHKFRDNKIILLGDTHDTGVTYDIISTRIPDGSDLVHLGDVGLGFGKPVYSIDNALSWIGRFNTLCAKLDITLYIIRGNHDNTSPRIWESKWSNVILIGKEDYATFPNGKDVLLLSGGVSIDRSGRIANETYWYDEGTYPVDNVEKCDIVFSHDTPEQFNHSSHTIPTHWKWYSDRDSSLLDDCLNQRLLVGGIIEKSEAKTIFYGHFHNNTTQCIDGVYARCVNINELFFFDADLKYKV